MGLLQVSVWLRCGTDGEFWLQCLSKEALSFAQMSLLVFGTNLLDPSQALVYFI